MPYPYAVQIPVSVERAHQRAAELGFPLIPEGRPIEGDTARHRPWQRLVVIEFDEAEPALQFERYLKTGFGREFARRHFRQTVPVAGRADAGRNQEQRHDHPRRDLVGPEIVLSRLNQAGADSGDEQGGQ